LFFNLLDGLAYDPEPLGAEAGQGKQELEGGGNFYATYSNCYRKANLNGTKQTKAA
jgi:hypothetical protein